MIEGLDISAAQPPVKADLIRKAGKRFGIVKAVEGERSVDSRFVEHLKALKGEGLITGVYQFALPDEDPIDDVRGLLDVIMNDPPPLPATLDLETMNNRSPSQVLNWLHGWTREYIMQTGTTPMIYTAPYFWKSLGIAATSDTEWAEFPLWVANYGVSKPIIPSPWKDFTFWQFAANEIWKDVNGTIGYGSWRRPPGAQVIARPGTCPGVAGEVDLNWFNGDMDALLDLCKLVGTERAAYLAEAASSS